MKELPNLKDLTDEATEALIMKLWEELQKLQKQLEKKPKKTAKNSRWSMGANPWVSLPNYFLASVGKVCHLIFPVLSILADKFSFFSATEVQ